MENYDLYREIAPNSSKVYTLRLYLHFVLSFPMLIKYNFLYCLFQLRGSSNLVLRFTCLLLLYFISALCRYSEIPYALGCDNWITKKVSKNGEFVEVLKEINDNPDKAAYVEILIDKYASNNYVQRLKESLSAYRK